MIKIKHLTKQAFYFFYGLWNFLKFQILESKKIRNAQIVFFFPYYHTGGAERVHINILKALQNKRCTVIFTHGSATKSFYEEFKDHAEVIELNAILNKKNSWINSLLQKKIIATINSSKSVHAVFSANTAYFYQILPKIKSSIQKIDLFHAFEEDDDRINDIVTAASMITNRIVINNKAKEDILKFYGSCQIPFVETKKIQIIQNGIELSNFIFKMKDESSIKIGFVGRWSAEKRPLLFLEIAKQIKTKYPSVSFVMAGTGMKSNLDKITASGIEFLGEIRDKATMNLLYEELHLILVPSVYEGFPMVIMEAMSHGVIPVSTNVGGISEHITHGINGLLVDELETQKIINAFCDAISSLLENPDLRFNLSQNSFLYAQKHFNTEKFNASYRKLLALQL